MNKRPSSRYRIPSFRGFRAFKPLLPESDDDVLDAMIDPSLHPEEQDRIKRYLQYADILINGSAEARAESGSDHRGPLSAERRYVDNQAA